MFTRDLKRLGKVPLAWLIIGGALITPSLYAWFNIAAFWNPFDNTKNLSIAVVNMDKGAVSTLTGEINVGDQLVDQLKNNDDLGWHFESEADAMAALKSGESYAAFMIPPNFSKNLLSITTGDFTQPKIQYYVNEKLNGVAPEITDTGATTVQTQMIDAFTKQVAAAAAKSIKEGGAEVELNLETSQSRAIEELGLAGTKIAETRTHLAELQTGIGTVREGLSSAGVTLTDMEATLESLRADLANATELADQAQSKLLEFTSTATSAYVDSAAQLADAAAAADTAAASLENGISKAQARVEAQIDALNDGKAGIADVRAFLNNPEVPLDPAAKDALLADLTTLDTQIDTVISALVDTEQGLSAGADAVQAAADTASAAFDDAAAAAKAVNSALGTHVPALLRPMAQLTASASSLSASFESQTVVLAEANTLLAGLDTQLEATSTALTSLDQDLNSLGGDLVTAATDLNALGDAMAWKQLTSLTTLDPTQIADFMATPVLVKQHTMFHTNSYGSLMGSLFINLSLWIGAFVLVVILKLEVDREGLPDDTTERQRYMGRWLLFAAIAMMQAIVLSIGNLIIGVQHVNIFVFVITPMLIGLAYLSIIYALSVTFGYIGKGLCIILVIMQIPGASGIYPIGTYPLILDTHDPVTSWRSENNQDASEHLHRRVSPPRGRTLRIHARHHVSSHRE